MSLKETIGKIKQQASEAVPDELLEIMHEATENLKQSGLVEEALGEGDSVPEFTLTNQDGEAVSSSNLLQHEALVLAFFRGRW